MNIAHRISEAVKLNIECAAGGVGCDTSIHDVPFDVLHKLEGFLTDFTVVSPDGPKKSYMRARIGTVTLYCDVTSDTNLYSVRRMAEQRARKDKETTLSLIDYIIQQTEKVSA